MAVEVIEGNLHPTKPTGGVRKYKRFKDLNITVPNGQVRPLGKVSAGGAIIDEIRRGGEGRFYLARADGATGLIGVRRPDGSKVYSHYQNIEPMLLIVGMLGLLGGVVKYGFGVEEFPLTPVVLGPVLLIFWFYLRSQRLSQQAEFEADGA